MIYVYLCALLVLLGVGLNINYKYQNRKNKQRTWVFCPECKVDLCSNDSLIYDDEEVVYKCKDCGNVSFWNFDIAPVAVLIRSDNGATDLKG